MGNTVSSIQIDDASKLFTTFFSMSSEPCKGKKGENNFDCFFPILKEALEIIDNCLLIEVDTSVTDFSDINKKLRSLKSEIEEFCSITEANLNFLSQNRDKIVEKGDILTIIESFDIDAIKACMKTVAKVIILVREKIQCINNNISKVKCEVIKNLFKLLFLGFLLSILPIIFLCPFAAVVEIPVIAALFVSINLWKYSYFHYLFL